MRLNFSRNFQGPSQRSDGLLGEDSKEREIDFIEPEGEAAQHAKTPTQDEMQKQQPAKTTTSSSVNIVETTNSSSSSSNSTQNHSTSEPDQDSSTSGQMEDQAAAKCMKAIKKMLEGKTDIAQCIMPSQEVQDQLVEPLTWIMQLHTWLLKPFQLLADHVLLPVRRLLGYTTGAPAEQQEDVPTGEIEREKTESFFI